jgi:GntR family histidine utilization transcriptional repressor
LAEPLFFMDGDGPAYSQVREAIARPILAGRLQPGDRIPPEQELVGLFAVSRMTVNRALRSLVEQGLITRRPRLGTVVARQLGEHAVLQIDDPEVEVTSEGARYSFERLERSVLRADASLALELQAPGGAELVHVRCLHRSDGAPFLLEDRYINVGAVPRVREESFASISPIRWLLDEVPGYAAEHVIQAVAADGETASRLQLSEGAPCLLVQRRTWRAETFVTAVSLYYPGDRHRLTGVFGPALRGRGLDPRATRSERGHRRSPAPPRRRP